MNSQSQQCGFVAMIGRPNVGKSTLLNHLLGTKLSITSRKPQTTRHRILGINTLDNVQIVYVDTPGLHRHEPRALNRYMNRAALSVLHEVDMIVFVVEALHWTALDAWICKQLQKLSIPIVLAINKIDLVKDREALLPFIEKHSKHLDFIATVPLSAKRDVQVGALQKIIVSHLPEGLHHFPPEQFTDRSDRFITAETVREKMLRQLGQEVPHSSTVTIDAFEEENKIIKIAACIWVEREGQKAIVIGAKGERLKSIGQQARLNLEAYFNKKVFLKLWVKVKNNWADDERALGDLGYWDGK